DNPGLEYIIVSDADGRVRYSTDLSKVADPDLLRRSIAQLKAEGAACIGKYFDTSTPIVHKGSTVGWLHLGERANIVEQLLPDIALDLGTVLVVATLVAFDLVRLLLAASFSTPLRGLQDFFARIAAGDFRLYLGRDFFGGIGRLNRALNATVMEINS